MLLCCLDIIQKSHSIAAAVHKTALPGAHLCMRIFVQKVFVYQSNIFKSWPDRDQGK